MHIVSLNPEVLWQNDDLPYTMTTRKGELVAMPHTQELEDRQILIQLGHSEEQYTETILTAFNRLLGEARQHGGRILHLSVTPYVVGLPFRIKALRNALEQILEQGDVWSATGADIVSGFTGKIQES